MRNVSFVVVGLLLAACGGEGENQPPKTPATPVATAATPAVTATEPEKKPEEVKPTMTPAQAMQKTMGEFGAAMAAKDAKKLASLYTDNAKIVMPGMPDTMGKDAIQKDFEKSFGMMKDAKNNATRIWIKNDVAIVEWAMAGTSNGEFMGMKGAEKPIGVMGVDAMWFTPEGLIKEQHSYMDVGTIMSQLGVTKQKARSVPTVTTNPPTVITATGSGDEQKNVDAATTVWGAFGKGAKGENDFVGGMADDMQWDDMTQADTMKGKDSGKKFFKSMTTAFPDLKSNQTNIWGIGDYVIVEGGMTGTHNGPFFGVAPTKKPVNMHAIDIIQMKNGKVVRGWSYGNSAEVMGQLGQLPKAPVAKDAKDAKDAKPAATPTTPATKK